MRTLCVSIHRTLEQIDWEEGQITVNVSFKLPYWNRAVGVLLPILLCLGCVASNNRPPVIYDLPDLVFTVGLNNSAELTAVDPDGDALEYNFTVSPQPPSFGVDEGGRPEVQPVTQGAIFAWTPLPIDAVGVSQGVYILTISAKDGRGGEASVSLRLSVQSAARSSFSMVEFIEPSGDGVFIESDCLDPLPIAVEGGRDDERVIIAARLSDWSSCDDLEQLGCPSVERFDDLGRSADLSWCPTRDQLEHSDHHPMILTAQIDGADRRAERSFFVRFGRHGQAVCERSMSLVAAEPEIVYGTASRLKVKASFESADGFDRPPLLVYSLHNGQLNEASQVWSAVPFEPGERSEWTAEAWGLSEEGQNTHLSYRVYISARGAENAQACLETQMTDWVTVPLDGLPPPPAGGAQCERCDDSSACQPGAICTPLQGTNYCLTICQDDADCVVGETCRQSLDEAADRMYVCMPDALNCGQICLADELEGTTGNDSVEASRRVETGSYLELTACVDDVDVYRATTQAGHALVARVKLAQRSAYLRVEGGYFEQPDDRIPPERSHDDFELVFRCGDEPEDVFLKVWSYNGADVAYDLEIEHVAEKCEQACQPDAYESVRPGSVAIELPFSEDLTICSGDQDIFSFWVDEGRGYRVVVEGGEIENRLIYSVWNRGRRLEARSANDQSIFEFIAEADGLYEVRVEGTEGSVSGHYRLDVSESDLGTCDDARPCPDGSRCMDGVCEGGGCGQDLECAAEEMCAFDQYSPTQRQVNGRCLATCQSDRDCAAGAQSRCKEVAPDRWACLPSGAQEIGMQCQGHRDCTGRSICLAEPGGYCAIIECREGRCPVGSSCREDADGQSFCRRSCLSGEMCREREGYTCLRREGRQSGSCIPR